MLSELARVGCSVGDTLETLDISSSGCFSNDLNCQELVASLGACGWFSSDGDPVGLSGTPGSQQIPFSVVSGAQMSRWRSEMKHAEKAVKNSRHSVA